MVLLSMILLPILVAPFAYLGERVNRDIPRYISITIGIFLALCTAYLVVEYPGNGFAFEEFYKIYPPFDFNLHLAVDGISLTLLAITAFLAITVTLSSWNIEKPGAYFFSTGFPWSYGWCFCISKPSLVLYFLGVYSCSDVLSHWYLGGRKQNLRCNEVLYLYPSCKCFPSLRNYRSFLKCTHLRLYESSWY